jgi:hypothetical protein
MTLVNLDIHSIVLYSPMQRYSSSKSPFAPYHHRARLVCRNHPRTMSLFFKKMDAHTHA